MNVAYLLVWQSLNIGFSMSDSKVCVSFAKSSFHGDKIWPTCHSKSLRTEQKTFSGGSGKFELETVDFAVRK